MVVNNIVLNEQKITNMIYEIRGKQLMLDSDLAKLYECKNGTKDLNKAVKRNPQKFPERICFQLSRGEYFEILRFQNGTLELEQGKYSKYLPFVFTEQGVCMLATVLKSEIASKVSLAIIDAFVLMRKYISNNLIEQKYINNQVLKNTEDIKILQESFQQFEEKKITNEIYFNGQIYDAYSKLLDIMKEAKKELIIIDNYADKSILDMIRNLSVNVIIICKSKGLLKEIDIKKYQEQYHNLKVIFNDTFHDRYLILVKSIVYHCGASLNYAGSKTFSINKLGDEYLINALIQNIKV